METNFERKLDESRNFDLGTLKAIVRNNKPKNKFIQLIKSLFNGRKIDKEHMKVVATAVSFCSDKIKDIEKTNKNK